MCEHFELLVSAIMLEPPMLDGAEMNEQQVRDMLILGGWECDHALCNTD